MNWNQLFESIRKWVTIVSSAIFLFVAYGAFAAIIVQNIFHLDGTRAILFVGTPIGLIVVVLMWKKLPRILGFDRNH